MFSGVDRIPACDGRTDGQTSCDSPRYAYASRGKNWHENRTRVTRNWYQNNSVRIACQTRHQKPASRPFLASAAYGHH